MEEWEHVDDFNLIDFSSQNDNLFFSVSPISHQQECQGDSAGFETVGYMDSGNVSQGIDQPEQVPELAQSEEPPRVRSGKYNFRKSLAWDNAFFTSAGVLDPEELTSMMVGREAVKKKILPGIEEDMQRSSDSISTLQSDHFTLQSLEVELFADIRASIQKSSTVAKGSFGRKSVSKDGNQDISSPNGDSVSQNQFKSKPVIKKVVTVHNLGVPECQPKVNTVVLGSKKAVKTGSSRSVLPRAAVTIGELASSPPKGSSKSRSATSSGAKATSLYPSRLKTENSNAKSVAPRVTSLSISGSTASSGIKVTSLGPSRLKTENGNAKTVTSRGSHESKISSSNGPCKILPMSGSTSKSSSRKPSTAKTQFTRSSSKGDSCDSPLSEGGVKPSSTTVRRKVPSRAVKLPSPRATPQSSSEIALKNKVTSENSDLAAYLTSSEVSSSISPASSVSEWSSISSSSAVNQKSNRSRSSVGSSSCRSEVGDALPFNIKARTNNRCQEIKRSAESVKKPALRAEVISGSSSTKPTGLRMPSPKIGYFDGVKSVHASGGAIQSHPRLPVALSKVGPGVSPRGISNIKHKVGKVPPGRVLTAKKHETQNPDVLLPGQGNPQVSPRNGDHAKMVESPVKVRENGSEEHDEVSLKEHLDVTKNEMMLVDPELNDSKTGVVNPKENLGVTKNRMMLVDPELNESKTDEVGAKENSGVTNNTMMMVDPEHNESKTDSFQLSTNAPEGLDAFKIDGHFDLGSNLNSCCKIGEKENVPSEDRVGQPSKNEGGVKSETVDLQTIESLQVTCSEVS